MDTMNMQSRRSLLLLGLALATLGVMGMIALLTGQIP